MSGLGDLPPWLAGDEGLEEKKEKKTKGKGKVKRKEEDWGRWEERHGMEHRNDLPA